jgi:hypothetical protein
MWGLAMGWPWVCQWRDENKSPKLWRQYKNLVYLEKILISEYSKIVVPLFG